MKEHKSPIQLLTIYFSLIAACTVMVVVIQLDLGKIASSSLNLPNKRYFDFMPINYIFAIIFSAVALLFNKFVLPNALKEDSEVLEGIQKYKTGQIQELSGVVLDKVAVQMIVTWALCETITVFGFSSYFLEPTQSWQILVNYLISLALFFYYSPKRLLNNRLEDL